MSKLRSINTCIWTDVWFETLNTESKLLFIYLVTNEKTNMLGVYEISKKKISFETGISESQINKYFIQFEKNGKIRYQNNRVILINYLKHQNYNLNMMKSAIDSYNDLPNELKIPNIEKITRDLKGFETLCNGFGMVRKVEVEYKEEVEEEIKVSCFDFDSFWEMYPHKVAKQKCETKYKNITEKEREQIKLTLDKFLKHKPFESYTHPNPEAYLNQKRWQDVIPENVIKVEPAKQKVIIW